MKPLLVSSGEPAGIGPDLCLSLAALSHPLVVVADKSVLIERAKKLGREIRFIDYSSDELLDFQAGQLHVLSLPTTESVTAGTLNAGNGAYVIKMLELAASRCLHGEFSGLVTAPVHKGIINQAGIAFTGHTELLANRCGVERVVMMLVCEAMKVALVTTHCPLQEVSAAITEELISQVVRKLHQGLQRDFAIKQPRICVAGLNPHAGEGGYLGMEEIDSIQPALAQLKKEHMDVRGPFPADTLFTPHYLSECDVFLTMYHDQGLPVLKYAGFGRAVNVTLGLPIVRTSVDHGTALALAGTGKADSGSLIAAVEMALLIVKNRIK
ncbi:MAG: 4-hydroxythreonine-4-phosphate dehydrogenase PdxA [Legionellales bacterium RIFCSPHIGHO2_12_FULL_42_9]|nr:MAG: 4-hydroxythreonine-4-phosphate dehydrogenase PdxA [Legionellales bacterium RIFCSPHIGHO2_12_FULL_42_9]